MQEYIFHATSHAGTGARIMPVTPHSPSLLSSGFLLVLVVILSLILLCAGCTDTPDAGQGSQATSHTTAGQSGDACTFDRLIGDLEMHLTEGDSCYFTTHTPIEFLNDLHMHPDTQVTVIEVPDNWITHDDVQMLMREIDSLEPAAPVVSPISSYWPFNQTSTVGNEALFLIEGYRSGKYPPGLCSLHFSHPNETLVRSWWETDGRWGGPGEKEAVRIAQDAHPELKGYPSDTFPPRSIRTERAPEGWYLAFIQEGSGVPIISARCYCVGNDRNVTLTGTANQSAMVMPWEFSPRECR